MEFARALADADLILTEGSMYERLRRHAEVEHDPHIAHSSLLYDEASARVVAQVHGEYIDVAQRAGLPMIVGAATWRASRERVGRSAYAGRRVNQDNIAFVKELVAERASGVGAPLWVSAGIGPRGDAYRPEEGLDADEAERFHAFQAGAIAEAGPDVVLAMTLPAFPEARGIARALEATGLPYLLSFVVRSNGELLDGTPLGDALDRIDQESGRPPLGYLVNCVHPTVLEGALASVAPQIARRVLGLRANTSAKSPEELALAEELITEAPDVFGEHLARMCEVHGLTIVGGCCGTGTEHIEAIARSCGAST